MTVLAPLVSVHQVERAALATLQKWMRTYLGLAESEFGYSAERLADVRGWGRQSQVDIERHPEDQIPYITVISPGMLALERSGEFYDAVWDIRVGIVVAGAKEEDARDMFGVYAACARALLVQQPWVNLTTVDRWALPDTNDVLDSDKKRTLAGAVLPFGVKVPKVLSLDAGPTLPDPLPDPQDGTRPDYSLAPTAETVEITVDQIEEP